MGKKRASLVMEFRQFLQELVKAKLSELTKEEILESVPIKRSALQAMIYRGEGGLDAWVTLIFLLYKIKPDQMRAFLIEIRNLLSQQRKLTQGELLWTTVGGQLSEDKRSFWTGIINFTEEVRPPFVIKRSPTSKKDLLMKKKKAQDLERKWAELNHKIDQIPEDIWIALTSSPPRWSFLRAALNLPETGAPQKVAVKDKKQRS